MRLRTTLALAALGAALSCYAQYPGAKPVPADVRAGFQAITQTDAKAWLGYLAGPECEGRGSGQEGYEKAAAFMAARFKEMGLKPMGENGTYFQYVRFTGTLADGTGFSVGRFRVPLGENLSLTRVRGGVSHKAPVVFLQASGDAKVPAGVQGKIVVAQLNSVSREFRAGLLASAKFVVESSELISDSRSFSSFGSGGGMGTSARMTPKAVAEFLASVGVTAKELIEEGKAELSTDLGEGSMDIKVENLKASEPNVVGLLEGSDPVLKHEFIGIGAHLDHLGKRGDVIYFGADDDGSGSTALIGVAKAFKTNKLKPKRSILFMAFAGEESGLVGSKFLADNPPVPLDKMICELQMDMVGRNSDGIQNGDRNRVDVAAENVDTMRLVGSQRISMELHKLILEQNEFVNFRFKYDAEDVYTRSDHYNFAAKGIPIAFQFDGFHPDYHRPTDTVDKINFEKLTNAAKLYFLVGLRAANRATAFAKDVPPSGGN